MEWNDLPREGGVSARPRYARTGGCQGVYLEGVAARGVAGHSSRKGEFLSSTKEGPLRMVMASLDVSAPVSRVTLMKHG